MEVAARLKHTRLSAQKCRLICDQVRGKSVERALDILKFSTKKAAAVVKKVLESAIANAEHNYEMDVNNLVVEKVFVDEGPTLKRFRPRAMGRASQINKRTSHITVVVSEKKEG